jgi:hypothetical protein
MATCATNVLAQLRQLNKHVSFLADAGANFDGRVLMEQATQARRHAIQLHHDLEAAAKDVGQRGRGLSHGRDIVREYDLLDASLKRLDGAWKEKMNDPARYPAPALPGPVNELFDLLLTLFDIWGKERIRQQL